MYIIEWKCACMVQRSGQCINININKRVRETVVKKVSIDRVREASIIKQWIAKSLNENWSPLLFNQKMMKQTLKVSRKIKISFFFLQNLQQTASTILLQHIYIYVLSIHIDAYVPLYKCNFWIKYFLRLNLCDTLWILRFKLVWSLIVLFM